jgi:tungstate transport system ATP-binding protein
MDTMSVLYELNGIEQYYDDKKVLSIDNLILEENQIIGFLGPNGSGKSTLLSLLSFGDKATQGEILFKGIDNKKLDIETKQSIVMVPQDPYLLKRTVFDNIAYGLRIRNMSDNIEKKVYEALEQVGLDSSFAKRKWSQLSGGEAQRVALASRLVLKPKVLILDEPTSGVDTNSVQLIKEAILLAKQKYNTTIFISSHDHNWLNNICDKKIALFQGELVESGSVNLLFAPWEKDTNGNLLKRFIDGQELTVPNSAGKKKDSVVMIKSESIEICKDDCIGMINENTLMGVINSIHMQQEGYTLHIELTISGVYFNCKISRKYMEEQRLLPGDRININIDLSEVCWI